jgi:type 1 fimbria pilin
VAGVFVLALVVAMLSLASSGRAAALGPSISSITPASGSVQGGESVTINGSGFVGPQGSCASGYDIWFGTDQEHGYAIAAPNYQVLSDSQISVTVPANFGGPVDVQVHDACGTSPVQSRDQFTYVYPSSECVSGSCSVSIGSTAVGTLGHVALGFLDGFNTDAGVTITPPPRKRRPLGSGC